MKLKKYVIRKKINQCISLLEIGWCRDEFHKKIGTVDHYCLLGAIYKVCRGNTALVLHRELTDFLYDNNYYYCFSIASFNDNASSKRVVINMLKKYLKTLE